MCGLNICFHLILRNKDPIIIVEPACDERDIVVTTSVRCMCVRPSVGIGPGHNLYICSWFSKSFDTVVLLVRGADICSGEGQGHI